ncbi:hypothetical protein J4459_01115 [Candidatus Woesearchaeota archaeon]|nr:hypothetical protein [Candidatus Woesearchaeota archaeon]
MAKKRTSKKTFIGKNSPSQLNTKSILIIVLVVAVLLILISSYTGNVSRRSFRSPRAMENSMNPSQGSGGSNGAGAKSPFQAYQRPAETAAEAPAENEEPVPCTSELTGRTRCSQDGRFVMEEYACSGSRPMWRNSITCGRGQVCQSDGNSVSCQECPTTETRECTRGSYGDRREPWSPFPTLVTRDCNGREVSRARGYANRVCVDGIRTLFRCNQDTGEIIIGSQYNCHTGGCDGNGIGCA